MSKENLILNKCAFCENTENVHQCHIGVTFKDKTTLNELIFWIEDDRTINICQTCIDKNYIDINLYKKKEISSVERQEKDE